MKILKIVLIIFIFGSFSEAKRASAPKVQPRFVVEKNGFKKSSHTRVKKISKRIDLNSPKDLNDDFWELNFGVVEIGNTAEVSYTLHQAASLSWIGFGPVTTIGSEFTVVSDTCANVILTGFSSCTFTLRFTPTALGAYTGTVSQPWDTGWFDNHAPPRSGVRSWDLLGDCRDPLANPVSLDSGRTACGSIINVDSRTVKEEVPIVGTNFSLVYSTEFAEDHIAPDNTIFRDYSFNPEGLSLSVLHHFDIFQGRVMNGNGSSQKTLYGFRSGSIWTVSRSGDEVYIFDYSGNHIETKTSITGATKYLFSYNSNKQLIKIEDAFGNETVFNRTSVGRLSSIVAPRGQVTTVATDYLGLITQVTNPQNESYSLEYKLGTDLLWKFTKPGGQVTTFSYDTKGKLTKDIGNGGNFWDLVQTLNYEDRQVTQTSKLGVATNIFNYEYEAGGNARWTTEASGKRTEYIEYGPGSFIEYDDTTGDTYQESVQEDPRFAGFHYPFGYEYQYISGNVREVSYMKSVTGFVDSFNFASMTDSSTVSGRTTTRTYNSATKKTTTTSPEGVITYYTINSQEQPVGLQVGSDTAWTYSYDLLGRLSSVAQGSKNGVTNTYNSAGFLSTVTNARSEQTSYTYDLAGRVTQVTLPDARVVGYSYDSNGNLLGVTPPNRPEHIFGFNAFELMGSYEPPVITGLSVKNTTYTYNDDKQLTSVIRPDTQTASYTYNATTGLLSSLNLSRGNNAYQYQYRSEKVSRVDSADGIASEFTYYGDNVLSEAQRRSSDDFLYAKLDYGFDTDHRQISRTLRGNSSTPTSTIATTLNDDDLPTQIGAMTLSYSYPSGRLSTTVLDKISDSRTYDAYGNLASYTAIYTPTSGPVQTLYSYTLTRDVMSRISSKSETVLGVTDIFDYTFDTAGRLITVLKNSSPYSSYAYDSNGNRTSGTHAGAAFTATFDDQDRMLTYNSRVYSYNSNGDTTQIEWNTTETSHYSYDAIGNLLTILMPDASSLRFDYDGNNRLVGISKDSVTQTRRIYQDGFRIAGNLDDLGIVNKEFVFGFYETAPEYLISSGTRYRVIKDHLGSPRIVVKTDDATVTQRLEYTDMGKITSDSFPGFQPYGFAGGIVEGSTKLVKFGQRFYDPGTGRWMTKDPIRFDGGDSNLYSYVENDPINWTDVSGTTKEKPGQVLEDGTKGLSGGGGSATGGGGKGIAPTPTCPNISPKISAKVQSQMKDRGWNPQMVKEAIATKGIPTTGKQGPATRYVHPSTGQSIVVDNASGAIFHVGGPGFKY